VSSFVCLSHTIFCAHGPVSGYEATDKAGNAADTVEFNVVLNDLVAPQFSAWKPTKLWKQIDRKSRTFFIEKEKILKGDLDVDKFISATDNVDGSVEAKVIWRTRPLKEHLGRYKFYYKAMDAAGVFGKDQENNVNSTKLYTVVVQDKTPPIIINVPDLVTEECSRTAKKAVALSRVQCKDRVDTSPILTVTPKLLRLAAVAKSWHTYECQDASENVAIKVSVRVVVKDTTPPVIVKRDVRGVSEDITTKDTAPTLKLIAYEHHGRRSAQLGRLRKQFGCTSNSKRAVCGTFKCRDACSTAAFKLTLHKGTTCEGRRLGHCRGGVCDGDTSLVGEVGRSSLLYTCTDRSGNSASTCVVLDVEAPDTTAPTAYPTATPTSNPTHAPIDCAVGGWKHEPCNELCGGGIKQSTRCVGSKCSQCSR
jgi:hypothetical protein